MMNKLKKSTLKWQVVFWTVIVYVLLFANRSESQADEAVLGQGRQYTQQFYDGELAPITERFSSAMTEAVGGEERLAVFRQQVLGDLGAEVEVLDEQVSSENGLDTYRRFARFEKSAQTLIVEWAFTAEAIEGFRIVPDPSSEAPSDYLEYQTKTDLRLPFNGAWFVFWGGRTVEQNQHAASPDQRFAYDFSVMKDGVTHRGEGTTNEEYYCFGLEIVAPGRGVVIASANDIVDQTPGELNAEQPLGNHVILDHQNGEFSFLAHLQQGSVTVAAGDEVQAGEVLGRCGNSGHSSEPHLHYHLQTTTVPFRGEGLPAQFQNYTADGEVVARGEPVQGQTIEP
jgi:murein DD-endopeptidase MepM/ murein hydrolase activator NlpD